MFAARTQTAVCEPLYTYTREACIGGMYDKKERGAARSRLLCERNTKIFSIVQAQI